MNPNVNEIDAIRAKFARKIEDGKRVMNFASSDDWGWYVTTVIEPTIEEYTERILSGNLDERQDMHVRGMIQGMKLIRDSVSTFVSEADKAKQEAKKFEEEVKNAD